MLNTRIWNDNWVSQLDPIEKLLFLYFLTNSYTNLSGIYEMPLRVAAVETGVDLKMVETVLPRLKPKVIHKDGWVILPNFPKYQNTENPKIMAGIQRELAGVPKDIYNLSIGYGYPIALIPILIPIPNLSVGEEKPRIVVSEQRDEGSRPVRKKKVTPEMQAVFDVFSNNPARFQWRLREVERESAAILHREFGLEEVKLRYSVAQKYKGDEMCPRIDSPSELLEKMPKMEAFLKKL